MEHKSKKQLWLENVLKQLYKKVDALETIKGKPRNYQKKKLDVPSLKISDRRKEEEKEEDEEEKEDIDPETVNSNEKQKQLTEHDQEKFWTFVDEFFQSNIQAKPFQARCKNGFFNSVKVPSTINYTHWKSEVLGSTIAFPSTIICDSFTFLEDPKEGLLKTEIEEETTLEERIYTKIQKIRMKKATDVIFKEVLEDGILKKAKKC